jgi:hypothetical protein
MATMDPYRDPEHVLRDRMAHLQRELDALAAKTRGLEAAATERERLTRELKDVERQLFEIDGRGKLEGLRIASPCKASWDQMAGDDRVRHCVQCNKNVYNFSAMTRAEAVTLVRERTGELCVRMYKREDGTVLTADCPVGAKKKVVRRLALVGAGLGAAAAASAFGFAATPTTGTLEANPHGYAPTTASAEPDDTAHMMGDVAVPMGTVAIPEPSAAPSAPPPPPEHVKMGKVAPLKRP